ncbi:CHAD domain-containing protein [Nisaea acidiphila]|uniref:CHAD domain-containing protein n=1 Tax=Nisaea acidiphila TaxID=1862145 RepID=A0A9J7AUA5_9PROT|nr:CHAD domain-containing protein [Nisaea acidiphila]UUX50065.1 CHAD domain-containing protein [Nisaea acidiphila]
MKSKSTAAPKESELRLAVPEKSQNRLKRLPLLVGSGVGRARSMHLRSTYYDTPDGALAAAGMNLRIRQIGQRFVQTLKIGSGWQAGVAERIEIEGWVREEHPVLDLIHHAGTREFLTRNGLWDRLETRFVTDFRRVSREVRFKGDFGEALVSADLDLGEVRSGNRSVPISELELELKEGEPAVLFELASAIHRTVPVRIEYRGKALRAEQLTSPPEPKPVRGIRPALTRGTRINEAAVSILKACQVQVAANEAAILESMDPEGPHQMRVALRRMRAALGMFRAFGEPVLTERVRAEAKWLATALGEAREWDVYIDDLHLPVERALGAEIPALKELRGLAEARQEIGYRDARAAVASARFTALQFDLGLLIESLSSGVGNRGLDHLARSEEFAASRLEKRFRKVRKMGRKAFNGPTEALHELRLEMKKMRYASEFFASLFDAKKAKVFSKAAARLQNLLGYANDYAVSAHQLAALLEANHGTQAQSLAKAAGVVIGWHGAEMVQANREIQDAWNRFLDAGRFWPKAAV